MVLLDMLRQQADLELVVAHFDHGIRDDSAEDRKLVEAFSKVNGLEFVYEEGKLGRSSSEAKARKARYEFLRKVLKDTGSAAIITAHHQDDVLETAIINILRGTGRKGLTALKSREDVIRPLLKVPKKELLGYAKKHSLKWREDPTNLDVGYLRNYVRHKLLTRFSEVDRRKLVNVLTELTATNRELDAALGELVGLKADGTLGRQWFNQLPHNVAREVMAAWLRLNGSRGFDSKILERLVIAAKTAKAGKTFPVQAGVSLKINADHLALSGPER